VVGKQVSHYRIIDLIREGGMGAVYRAQDLNLQRLVAIKVLKSSRSLDAAAAERFSREALAVSRIDHPNVITLFEVLREADAHYIVMQYIDGESLRERSAKGPMPVGEALRIACEVAAGLCAAHKIGVVHRDLKPENVMLTSAGTCKVLDFGVAHLIDSPSLTDPGGLVGTIRYMAPEQLCGEAPDPRTDVHALGALLYELLTGVPAMRGTTEAEVINGILNVRPASVSATRPDLPDDIVRIVDCALEKQRRHRYPSMSAMLTDLDIVRRRIHAATGTPTEPIHAHRPIRTRPLAIASLLTLLAVVVYAITGPCSLSQPVVMVARWENTTGDRSLDWLCSGIMDCLIRALGGREGLNVVSRQTVVSALGAGPRVLAGLTPTGPAGIANQLGARYMVAGTLETRLGVLHVNCDLIDVHRGTLIRSWSRDLPDVTLQFLPMIDEFAASIAAQVGPQRERRRREARSTAQTLTRSVEALKLYNEALERNEMTDTHSALVALRAATSIDTTFTDAHLLLAQLTPEHGERERHLTLAMTYRFSASRTTRMLVEAEQLVDDDQIDAARQQYEAILAEQPTNLSARASLAGLLRAQRRFSEATAEYEVMHAQNPFDYSYYPDWAIDYADAGRKDRALALLRGWRAKFPEEIAPVASLIGQCSIFGDYELGLTLCDTLAALRPTADLLMRGLLLAELGRLRAADSTFQVLEHHPDLYRSRTRGTSYRAYVAFRRDQFADGLKLISKPLQEQPDAYNHWLAGILAAGARDTATANLHARAIASEFLDTGKDSLDSDASMRRRFHLHLRGMIALADAQPESAAVLFRGALHYAGPSDAPYFRTYLASALIEAGRPEQAVAELERALAFNPRGPETLLRLGDALIRMHRYDRARQVLQSLKTIWRAADLDDPLNQELNRLLKTASS